MNLRLLQEPHNFKNGNTVIIKERNFPDTQQYCGKIVQILELSPVQRCKEYKYITVPYFYVSFSKEIVSIIIKRGWNILYNNKIEIVGNIHRNSSNFIDKIYIYRKVFHMKLKLI